MDKTVQVCDKYMLSVDEAAEYFHIGETKIRQIISNDRNAPFILWNGNRPLIKRRAFEKYIDRKSCI